MWRKEVYLVHRRVIPSLSEDRNTCGCENSTRTRRRQVISSSLPGSRRWGPLENRIATANHRFVATETYKFQKAHLKRTSSRTAVGGLVATGFRIESACGIGLLLVALARVMLTMVRVMRSWLWAEGVFVWMWLAAAGWGLDEEVHHT
jgi:hypothetical protein